MSFADDTAVTPAGAGRWTAHIHEGWDIGGHANGGYLMAIATRAALASCARPDPVTVTAHFIRPAAPGAATATADTIKQGKRFATTTAALWREDERVLQLLVTAGSLDDVDGPEHVDAAPPDLPPPEECVPLESTTSGPPPFVDRVRLRLHPADAGYLAGAPSGEARVRGWFRLADDEAVDTTALLLAVDSFPPTIFNAHLPVGWTPTLELTAHVRARPVPGWLRCEFSTRFVTGGFLEEDGVVWDESDRLVAQSRQLALVPRPSL